VPQSEPSAAAAAAAAAAAQVLYVMDGDRLSQLLVALSWLDPQPSLQLVDPLVRELMRNKGNKLPAAPGGATG
jgi:hypothetical protein